MNNKFNQGPRRSGKVLAGMILLAVGALLLLNNIGYFFPNWLFSWPMLLIVFGLFVGFKHNFRNPGGVILILLGCLFLAKKYFHMVILWHYVWPIIIMLVGLWMIFGNRQRRYYQSSEDLEKNAENAALNEADYSNSDYSNPEKAFKNPNPYDNISATDDDYINSTSVFGGTKKLVISKNFKGGDVETIMGGAEINLLQADIQGRAILNVTQIMGGTKIIIPSNWVVNSSEMVAILGGIDDKRIIQPGGADPTKVLVIKGTSILGGIDIHSY